MSFIVVTCIFDLSALVLAGNFSLNVIQAITHFIIYLKQKNDELIDVFFTCCRNQVSKFRFRDKAEFDERIIKQLIVGNKHKKMRQERLLENGE